MKENKWKRKKKSYEFIDYYDSNMSIRSFVSAIVYYSATGNENHNEC